MPTLPSNCNFYSARFCVYYYYNSTVTTGVLTAGVYQVQRSWFPNDLTWNSVAPIMSIYIPPDRLSAANLSTTIGAYADSPLIITFDVTEAVSSWYTNPSINYGIALMYESGSNTEVSLKSFEAESEYGSYFRITYTEPQIVSGVYRIKNVETGLYLDTDAGGVTEGTRIQQWSSALPEYTRSQLFKISFFNTLSLSEQLNYYTIRSMTNCSLGMKAAYTGASRNVTLTEIPYSEALGGFTYSQIWAISKSGDYYTLKNGDIFNSSYLTATASTTNGTDVFTADMQSSYSKWILEPYTGEALHGVTITSYTSPLITSEIQYYTACMYDQTVGVNGPVGYSVSESDGSATNKATIDPTTGRLEALKSGTVYVGVTYPGSPWIWRYAVTIIESMEGVYFFRNGEYDNYMQIDNNASPSNEGAMFELWGFDADADQKWEIDYIGNELYKIISIASGKVVTAPSSLNDNITQTNYTGSATQHWKITFVSDGIYRLSPQTNLSYYMAAGDGIFTANGRNVEMRESQSDGKDEWFFSTLNDYPEIFLGYHVPNVDFSIQCIGNLAQGSTWYPLIQSSATEWNTLASTNISVTTELSAYTCEVDSYVDGWYGLATLYNNSGVITTATIQINSRVCSSNSNPRKSTITHEIGHLLGLKDNPPVSANKSLMNHNRNRDTIYTPQYFDIENVKFIFN